MKANILATLISFFIIGSEEISIGEYVFLAWEEIVDAENIMHELVDLT